MIRLMVFGLVIAIGLLALMALSSAQGRREPPIDVDPVDSSSERAQRASRASRGGKASQRKDAADDIIDVEPIES